MRLAIVSLVLVPLLGSATALAQSHQGGPQGLNPGAGSPVASTQTPPVHGSGQGGALGINPGATVQSGSSGAAVQGSGQGGPLGQPNRQAVK